MLLQDSGTAGLLALAKVSGRESRGGSLRGLDDISGTVPGGPVEIYLEALEVFGVSCPHIWVERAPLGGVPIRVCVDTGSAGAPNPRPSGGKGDTHANHLAPDRASIGLCVLHGTQPVHGPGGAQGHQRRYLRRGRGHAQVPGTLQARHGDY